MRTRPFCLLPPGLFSHWPYLGRGRCKLWIYRPPSMDGSTTQRLAADSRRARQPERLAAKVGVLGRLVHRFPEREGRIPYGVLYHSATQALSRATKVYASRQQTRATLPNEKREKGRKPSGLEIQTSCPKSRGYFMMAVAPPHRQKWSEQAKWRVSSSDAKSCFASRRGS